MKEEIYKKIIKNSKIPYLKINCKKDDNNKFIAIEVIDQSKEAERFFHLLTENNILNKENNNDNNSVIGIDSILKNIA